MIRFLDRAYGPKPLDPVELGDAATSGMLLRALYRAERGLLIRGAIAGIAWAGSLAVVPPVIGLVIDRGVLGDESLTMWLIVLGAVGGFAALTEGVRHYHASRLFTASHMRLARTVMDRVLDEPGLDEVRAPGDLTSAVQNDGERIGNLFDLCCRGIGTIVVFVVVAVGLVISSWQIGLVIVIGTPLALFAAAPLWSPLERRTHHSMEVMGEAAARSGDSIAGLRVASGIGATRSLVDRNEEMSVRVRDAAVDVARIESAWRSIEVGLPGLFLVVVLWVSGRFAVDGRISPGQMVAFLGLATFIAIPVATFVEIGSVVSEVQASARRIVDVISDTNPAPTPSSLSDIEVRSGVITGIVAPPAQLEAVRAAAAGRTSGGITINGEPISGLVSASDPFLFAGTVRTNVLLDDVGEVSTEVLHVAAVDEFVASFPDHLDEDVSTNGRSLSGGQRQRVGLARALLTDVSPLVLIEPTNAVDSATEAEIATGLALLRRGRTTVLATVSPLLLAVCDEVVVVGDFGRPVVRGSFAEVAGHPIVRALVFGERP
jgi:ABC-type multidrug transport system fused ATPase/permease subunit